MSILSGLSLMLGSLFGVLSAGLILKPCQSTAFAARFHRSRITGALLACIALSWSTILLIRMNLGFLEVYKPLLLFLAPASFMLTVLYVKDLLAPRALGGLLLLIPSPVLDAARWHESPWRYFAVVSAYVMVVSGLILVLHPYMARKWTDRLLHSLTAARSTGAILGVYALIWLVLALTAY